jgi:Transcriptional Coactivator p15 (PC4)
MKTLIEWKKRDGNIIRFAVGLYKKKIRLDIREFYRAEDAYKPTKKGINLPADAIEELVRASERALKVRKRLRRKAVG